MVFPETTEQNLSGKGEIILDVKNHHFLAEAMCKYQLDWKKLARRLGLPDYEIGCIVQSYRKNLYEQSIQCLQRIDGFCEKDNIFELLVEEVQNMINQSLQNKKPIIGESPFNLYHSLAVIAEEERLDWKCLGIPIGLYIGENRVEIINRDFDTTYEKCYQLLDRMDCLNGNNTLRFDARFWGEQFKGLGASAEVVKYIEKLDDYLIQGREPKTEADVCRQNCDYRPDDLKRFLLSHISENIPDWKALAVILGFSHGKINVIENNYRPDQRCWEVIYAKCNSSQHDISQSWPFWRTALWQVGKEGMNIVKELEVKYPKLIEEVDHKKPSAHLFMKDGHACRLHYYGVQDDFKPMPFHEDKVVHFQVGEKTVDLKYKNFAEKVEKMDMFKEKWKSLSRRYVFDFTNPVMTDKILAMFQNYFQKKKGIAVKNYSLHTHYSLFGKVHFDILPVEKYFVYLEKERVLIHIFKLTDDSYLPALLNLVEEAKLAITLYELKFVLQTGIVLHNCETASVASFCGECDRAYLARSSTFETVSGFQQWYNGIENELTNMKKQLHAMRNKDRRCSDKNLSADSFLKKLIMYKFVAEKL